MKRKQIEHLIETVWESHTTKDGTVYVPFTPRILADVLVRLIEESRALVDE